MTASKEIEVTGLDVNEAVESGLKKLGVSRSEVDIEVLEEGRRGLLGIGGRDAVVRLRVKPSPEPIPAAIEKPAPEPEPKPLRTVPEPVETAKEPVSAEFEDDDEAAETEGDTPSEAEIETAVQIVGELLDLMKVEATVSSRLSEPDDLTGKQLLILDVAGDELSLLIGPRGETLDALQYLSRLMAGHRLQQRANFVIDVSGYREQRQQALSRLAERMAAKAVKRGSPVTLEAMPAHERRIIHMALRDSPDVTTESTGEGKRRRVRIYPR